MSMSLGSARNLSTACLTGGGASAAGREERGERLWTACRGAPKALGPWVRALHLGPELPRGVRTCDDLHQNQSKEVQLPSGFGA